MSRRSKCGRRVLKTRCSIQVIPQKKSSPTEKGLKFILVEADVIIVLIYIL